MFGSVSRRDRIFRKLADARKHASPAERDQAADGRDFEFDDGDGVPVYFDRGNRVVSDDGLHVAYRAVTFRGELLWIVFTSGKPRGYHSDAGDPYDAFEACRQALIRRRLVEADWDEVKALAWKLRFGLARMDIQLRDVQAAAVSCPELRDYARRFGRPGGGTMSGFALAWMMRFQPRLGYVLREAAVRRNVLERGPGASADAIEVGA